MSNCTASNGGIISVLVVNNAERGVCDPTFVIIPVFAWRHQGIPLKLLVNSLSQQGYLILKPQESEE